MGRGVTEDRALALSRAPSLYAVALVATTDPEQAARVASRALTVLLGGPDDPDDPLQPGERARRALEAALGDVPLREPCESPDPGDVASTDLADAVEAALRRLGPRDRRVLGQWAFDDLPLDPSAEQAARAGLAEELRTLPWTPATDEALHAYLDAHPMPTDLVEGVQAHLLATRRRRTLTIAGAALALAVLVGGLGLLLAREADEASTATGPRRLPAYTVDGMQVRMATPEADEARLPVLPGALEDVGVTPTIGLPQGDLPTLSAGLVGTRSVRGILVRRLPDGTGRAVLLIPRGSPQYVELPDVVIPPRVPGFQAVNPRSISRDRHQVVLPVAEGVVVVDVATGRRQVHPVSLDRAESVGFSEDESCVIVSSTTAPRRVVLADGAVQPMAPPGNAGRFQLVVDAAPNLWAFDGRGSPIGQYGLQGPIVAFAPPTVTSQSGWSAAGARFNEAVLPVRGQAGLSASTVDVSPQTTALVAGIRDDRDVFVALAWAPGDRLLYLAPSHTVWRILAWDVHTGEQFRVSELPPPDGISWLGELTL